MKHILTLDGGGIRGVFSLEVLLRIETLLREHFKAPKLILADHFEFFRGNQHRRHHCHGPELGDDG